MKMYSVNEGIKCPRCNKKIEDGDAFSEKERAFDGRESYIEYHATCPFCKYEFRAYEVYELKHYETYEEVE